VDIAEADINKGVVKIVSTYYTDITKLINQLFRSYRDVPTIRKEAFLSCASKLLELQIMDRLKNTMEHLLFVMSDPLLAPLIKVSVGV
jgi:hypothetical protein